jgi:CYTH domain-containing protein
LIKAEVAEKIEIERRWKLKHPLSMEAIHQIVAHTSDIEYINQIYLKGSAEEKTERIRAISRDFFSSSKEYWHTKKKLIEHGVNEEDEAQISAEEYQKLLKKADPQKEPITKVRYTFDYDGQDFELDIFPKRKGLLILELELNNKQQTIVLPPFLEIVKEITDEKHYRNYYLADRDWREMGEVVQKTNE